MLNPVLSIDTVHMSVIWSIYDIQHVDDSLSDEECIKVLHYLRDNHDAEIGINWDVIRDAIEVIKGE